MVKLLVALDADFIALQECFHAPKFAKKLDSAWYEKLNQPITYLHGYSNNLKSPKPTPALIVKPPLVKPYTSPYTSPYT